MRETRTERCGQQLVNAQTSINRAVFELNSRENGPKPGYGPKPRDEYTLSCVLDAVADLSAAALILRGRQKRAA